LHIYGVGEGKGRVVEGTGKEEREMRDFAKASLLFAAGALFTGLAFVAFAGEARAQLYGSDEFGNLFTYDVTTGATTLVGASGTLTGIAPTGCCTEIEYDNTTGRGQAPRRSSGSPGMPPTPRCTPSMVWVKRDSSAPSSR
jgi:hypothetical protein